MATGMKGLCYKEPSQLNNLSSIQPKHSQLRNFWDETRHFTRLSSTLFENVIYESLYGCSVPGMPEDIMGGSAKRYSSVSSDLGNESKRQSIQVEDLARKEVTGSEKIIKSQKVESESCKQSPVVKIKNNDLLPEKNEKTDMSPNLERRKAEPGKVFDMPSQDVFAVSADLSSYSAVQETDLSNGKISAAHSVSTDDLSGKSPRARANSSSELGQGRFRRTSSQIDITSNPVYKEIYANNLRQYGFLLAKKLGISNQSPKELRATYLQNRQKAELRREQLNIAQENENDEASGTKRERSNSFADFGRRSDQCGPAIVKGRPICTSRVPKKDAHEAEKICKAENLSSIENNQQLSNTDSPGNNDSRQTASRQLQRNNTVDVTPTPVVAKSRMRRSNTIEYLDRIKDKPSGSGHSRSTSDLTAKYSNSLTDISEMEGDDKKKLSRESLRRSCVLRKISHSSNGSPPDSLGSSSETLDKSEDFSHLGSSDSIYMRQHSLSFGSDKDSSAHTTPVIMRRLNKKSHDPHKRLSAPLPKVINHTTSCPEEPERRSSIPDKHEHEVETDLKSVMSSLSVPDLYHQSTFGKEKLIDAYCKQDVPPRKLSVASLRRHSEAKERLEQRMSKLKSFEGVLTEADTFMKDIQSRKSASKSIVEEPIPE